MASPGYPTLDQLRIFLAVVDEGSFNAAARKLNRAVSVISYGIVNLEAQLGVSLFDREGSKKPRLTEAGQAVLSEARAIAGDVDGLRAKVRGLLEGLEAEVALAVDVLIPSRRVAAILREFQFAFPTVALRLHVEALGAIAALVASGTAHLAIGGPVIAEDPSFERTSVGSVELIPVAAPNHALAQMAEPRPGAARNYIQLVLTDRSPLTQGRDFGVMSSRTWRLADLGAKHALLLEGIGWGNMPREMVQADLDGGRLVQLHLPDHRGGIYGLSALWRRDLPPGPATRWLLERFRQWNEGAPTPSA
ncbi:MAG TPA: LysR family transcriptional regulator [Sphingomicrobium sp.]|nr:LysR family transcriptional regulator [Sphingomicrobium sp.]